MRCNFRCRYCYVKPIYSDKDLSIKTADAFVNFIKRNVSKGQKIIINFHGGEPLINFEIIKYIVSRIKNEMPNNPSDFGMTTNGSLLTDDIINFIGKYVHYNCSISIDGTPETMKLNRFFRTEKSNYNLIEENAKKLIKVNPHTRIRMTYDRLNVNSLFENICYFIEMGFTTIVPVADYYTDTWTNEDFKIIMEQFSLLSKYISDNNSECSYIESLRH